MGLGYKRRLFGRFARYISDISSQISEEIKRLDKMERDYHDKMKLFKMYRESHDKGQYKKLKRMMGVVKGLTKRDKHGVNEIDRIGKVIEEELLYLAANRNDRNEQVLIDRLLSDFRSEKGFFEKLNVVYSKQIVCFERGDKKGVWEWREFENRLLALFHEEGELLGQKNAATRGLIAEKKAVSDIKDYDKLREKNVGDVVFKDLNLGIVKGVIYASRDMSNFKAGIVVCHGIFGDKTISDLFCKRMASFGYIVYTINMPGHASDESEAIASGKLEYGYISEFIRVSVKFVASSNFVVSEEGDILVEQISAKLRRVGVVGHSMGGAATAFACFGYNSTIEHTLYDIAEEYANIKLQLSRVYEALERYDSKHQLTEKENGEVKSLEFEREKLVAQFNDNYLSVKNLIFASLKDADKKGFSRDILDAAVFLSPPHRFQEIIPPPILSLLKAVPNKILKYLTRSLVLDRKADIAAYLSQVKNPVNYLELIHFFSSPWGEKARQIEQMIHTDEFKRRFSKRGMYKSYQTRLVEEEIAKLKGNGKLSESREMRIRKRLERKIERESLLLGEREPTLNFFKAYKKRIVGVIPKLLIYGTWDTTLGTLFSKGRARKIEEDFSMSGNLIIKRMHGMSHFLNPRWQFDSIDILESENVAKLVVDFFDLTIAGSVGGFADWSKKYKPRKASK